VTQDALHTGGTSPAWVRQRGCCWEARTSAGYGDPSGATAERGRRRGVRPTRSQWDGSAPGGRSSARDVAGQRQPRGRARRWKRRRGQITEQLRAGILRIKLTVIGVERLAPTAALPSVVGFESPTPPRQRRRFSRESFPSGPPDHRRLAAGPRSRYHRYASVAYGDNNTQVAKRTQAAVSTCGAVVDMDCNHSLRARQRGVRSIGSTAGASD